MLRSYFSFVLITEIAETENHAALYNAHAYSKKQSVKLH